MTPFHIVLAFLLVPLLLVGALGLLLRGVDKVAQRHIIERTLAKGSTLDKLGAAYGMTRRPRESDADYRSRIARSVSNVHRRDDWIER